MGTYSKEYLSGSSNGRPIPVDIAAVTVHTPHATAKDEIWLWVENTTATAVTFDLFIDDGSIVNPDDYFCKGLSIPGNSPPIEVLKGIPLTVAANVLKALASVDNLLTVHGYVNRIT